MLINVNYSAYNSEIQLATVEMPSVGELVFEFFTDETDPENPVEKIQMTNYDTLGTMTNYEFTKAEFIALQRLMKNLSLQW